MRVSLIDHLNKSVDIKSFLTIEHEAFSKLNEETIRDQLQVFARSTRIEVDSEKELLLLCGTDLTHHCADPHLKKNIHTLGFKLMDDDYSQFFVHLDKYDLCMEDSWTGYFVAQLLSKQISDDPLIFIHLDDHTDMMSTLLVQTPEGLIDPSTRTQFDPVVPQHWKSVIKNGAVGIGSFVTALYYLKQPVHVLHLNHALNNQSKCQYVIPHVIKQPLMPHTRFATILKQQHKSPEQLGTYIASTNIFQLLTMLPKGRVIVHIDLDYFINDYNGNIGAEPTISIAESRNNALDLMRNFFTAISHYGVKPERWIIGTSPGFCSVQHWKWLLNGLSKQIELIS